MNHLDARDYVAWGLAGALWALVVLGALSIGIFVLPVAMFATWYASRRASWSGAAGAALCGVAVMPAYVAIMNRDGPGQICHSGPNWETCSSQLSPWPWAAGAAVLLAAGITLIVHTVRHDKLGG